jgi:uncharacterized protein (DUF1501 family)
MTTTPTEPQTAPCGCPEDTRLRLSRRSLLRMAGGVAGGAFVASTLSEARLAFSAPGAATTDTLVILSLRGGMDGLSVVVPAGDKNYAANRPTIAIPMAQLHQVDSMFGLHPAMAPLFPLWDAGKVAAVHAVGQAAPTRSHFEAMDEMERAAPGSSMRTGWIDRTLGALPDGNGFEGIQVGSPDLPHSMIGPNPKFALNSIGDVKLAVGDDIVSLQAWRSAAAKLHAGARPEVSAPLASALGAVGTMRAIPQTKDLKTLGYPDGGLSNALHDVARLVKANVGLRVATLDFGSWDMHSDLGRFDGGWMKDQLTELSGAMAAFATELGPDLNKVTLVTLSEFGRRVQENGSGGLDHGHGNVVLMLGGNVVGKKVYGRWPGLAADALDDGDLAGTTDYRAVLAEVLNRRLGVAANQTVFPKFTQAPLGIVKAR